MGEWRSSPLSVALVLVFFCLVVEAEGLGCYLSTEYSLPLFFQAYKLMDIKLPLLVLVKHIKHLYHLRLMMNQEKEAMNWVVWVVHTHTHTHARTHARMHTIGFG